MIIYKITNVVNGKIYIGQTTKSIERRFKQHSYDSSRCEAIHNAIRKYGIENFTIEEIDSASNIDELNEKEMYWVAFYNSLVPNGYNLKEGGIRPSYSEEAKEHMKQNHKDFSGCNNPNYSRRHSKEAKELIRQSRLGTITSEEVKMKLRINNPRSKKVMNIETGEIFNSSREAEEKNNLSHGSISVVCRGKGKTAGGFHWIYLKEGDAE